MASNPLATLYQELRTTSQRVSKAENALRDLEAVEDQKRQENKQVSYWRQQVEMFSKRLLELKLEEAPIEDETLEAKVEAIEKLQEAKKEKALEAARHAYLQKVAAIEAEFEAKKQIAIETAKNTLKVKTVKKTSEKCLQLQATIDNYKEWIEREEMKGGSKVKSTKEYILIKERLERDREAYQQIDEQIKKAENKMGEARQAEARSLELAMRRQEAEEQQKALEERMAEKEREQREEEKKHTDGSITSYWENLTDEQFQKDYADCPEENREAYMAKAPEKFKNLLETLPPATEATAPIKARKKYAVKASA